MASSYLIDRDGKVVDAWEGNDEPRAIAALQKTGGELADAVRRDMDDRTAKVAPEVAAAAKRLFQAIRDADYDHDGISTPGYRHRPAKEINYSPMGNERAWVHWVCQKFKTNPITDVQLGSVFANPAGLPTVHYELRLKDGEILRGDLPFYLPLDFQEQDPRAKQWYGEYGLDWHLKKNR